MQLSMFSDYALRVMVHLAASPDRLLTTRQIAALHGARYNHLAKVTSWLVHEGYVHSVRGRSGGIQLARDPTEINLGKLLRDLEADKPLVECFGADGGHCQLSSACGLSIALGVAQEAFFKALEGYTLASTISLAPKMPTLLTALNEAMVEQS